MSVDNVVMVTGVAGFIGSNVAARLLREGHRVVGVDDLSQGYERNIPAGVDFVRGDLADPGLVRQLPTCRAILHLAGQSSGEISFDSPVADLNKNVVSTLNLIERALDTGAERFLYASSMSVYGAQPDAPTNEQAPCVPLSCYGAGKQAAEQYLRIYSRRLPAVSIRMFNVYGPGQDLSNLRQGMVSIFVQHALASGRVHVKGALDRYRDIIFIDDVADAWCRLLAVPLDGHVAVNLGTGRRTTVGELLEAIVANIPGTTYYTEGATPGDQHGIYADVTRLRQLTGKDRFVSLADGLRRFVDWARLQVAAVRTDAE